MQFLHQFNQERSNTVHLARTLAHQLFDLSPNYFMKNFDRTSAPEVRALLENLTKPGEKYPLWAPLLFPNNDVNSIHPFRSAPLVSVCISIKHMLTKCTKSVFSSFEPSYTDAQQSKVRVVENAIRRVCSGM